MSIIKSFSVGEGDMFYIKHGNDNFTMIDCFMHDDDKIDIVTELLTESRDKTIKRFISTHPDEDHIKGLAYLSGQMNLLNFYCVKNEATKPDQTDDFDEYCFLRDHQKKAFYLYEGCGRKWMNINSNAADNDDRGSSGLNILWPITDNEHYETALKEAKEGKSPNNISPIIKYGLKGGITVMWMGDLHEEFMDKIKDDVTMEEADILFAPHHGRDKVPSEWLDDMNPKIVIIGEAPSENLNYYDGFNTITQNSAGDIVLDCTSNKTHIFVGSSAYSVNFLTNEYLSDSNGYYYIGTLQA